MGYISPIKKRRDNELKTYQTPMERRPQASESTDASFLRGKEKREATEMYGQYADFRKQEEARDPAYFNMITGTAVNPGAGLLDDPRMPGQTVKDVGTKLASGYTQTNIGMNKFITEMMENVGGSATRQQQEYFESAKEKQQERAERIGEVKGLRKFGYQAIESLPQMAPYFVHPVAGLVTTFTSSYGNKAMELEEQGATQAKQQLGGLLSGGLETGVSALLAPLKTKILQGKGSISEVVANTVGEAGEEMLQEFLDPYINDMAIPDYEMPDWRTRLANMLDSGATALVAMLMTWGIGNVNANIQTTAKNAVKNYNERTVNKALDTIAQEVPELTSKVEEAKNQIDQTVEADVKTEVAPAMDTKAILTNAEINNLSQSELRTELELRDLDTRGTKAQLRTRLKLEMKKATPEVSMEVKPDLETKVEPEVTPTLETEPMQTEAEVMARVDPEQAQITTEVAPETVKTQEAYKPPRIRRDETVSTPTVEAEAQVEPQTMDQVEDTQMATRRVKKSTPDSIVKSDPDQVARLSEFAKVASEMFDLPIKRKKFRQKALGIYKSTNMIRVKNSKDVDTIAHEVGHSVDRQKKLYESLSDAQKAELFIAGKPVSRETYSKQQVEKEGIAEFFSTYLQSRALAAQEFPETYEAFDKAVNSEPQWKEATDYLNNLMTAYNQQTAEQRVKSNIRMKTNTRNSVSLTAIWDRFLTMMVDANHPIYKTVKNIVGSVDNLPAQYNPITLTRLSATSGIGKTQTALERGLIDPKTNKFRTRGLYDIIDKVQREKRMEDFASYAVSLRAIELEERNIQSGINLEDAKEVVEKYKDDPLFNETLKELYEYNDTLIRLASENDIITPDAYHSIKEANRYYVPFNRVIDAANSGGSGSRDVFMRIKGAELDIVNPLESIVRNTYTLYNAIDRNNSLKSLFDLARKYENTGKYFDKVPAPMKGEEFKASTLEKLLKDNFDIDLEGELGDVTLFKPGKYSGKDNVVSILRRGKREFYEIHDKALFESITGHPEANFQMNLKLLQYPARALRTGATELSDSFILKNFIRDNIAASVYSKNGLIPFLNTTKGLADLVGKSDMYYRAISSGALNNAVASIDRDYIKNGTRKLYTRDKKEKALDTIKHPVEMLRELNESVENSTRIGEFKAVYDKAKAKGKPEQEALYEAALSSRDLMDFMRAGYVAREINKIIPFFNASIQGTEKMFRSIKNDPLTTVGKGVANITAMSVFLSLMNEDDERIKRLSNYYKDMYWLLPIGDQIIKIPKPHELGLLFGSGAERMLRYFKEEDPKAFDGYAQQVIATMMPELLPQAYRAPIEASSNYSFFYGGNIVPESEEHLPNYMQFGASNSEFSKLMGEVTKDLPEPLQVSPRMLDYTTQNMLGSGGKILIDTIDKIIETIDSTRKIEEPPKGIANAPVVRGLILDPYAGSQYIEDFYSYVNDIDGQYREAKALGDVPEELANMNTYKNKMQKYMAGLTRAEKAIEAGAIPGEDKKGYLQQIMALKDMLAQKTLNNEQLTLAEVDLLKMYDDKSKDDLSKLIEFLSK